MRPYLFVFRVKPKADNSQAQALSGAHATIITFHNSAESAYETSINFINEHGWDLEETVHALEPSLSQFAELDAVLQSVYRKAELNGISAHFESWPKIDRPGIYSFETLRIPPKKNI